MAKEPKNDAALNYEEKLEAAKKIIAELGKQDLPLDRGVSLFKEARILLDGASKLLEKAKNDYEEMEAAEQDRVEDRAENHSGEAPF